jgi:hypothetical protein
MGAQMTTRQEQLDALDVRLVLFFSAWLFWMTFEIMTGLAQLAGMLP